jgi:hypothetical protein
MKLRALAFVLVGLGLLGLVAWAPVARAEDEPGGDLKAQIKKKMEAILELMRANEEALLKLSTGSAAETKRVDVPVPEGEQGGQAESGNGAAGGQQGKEAAEALRRLLDDQRSKGGRIPDELKQLVEMIPL